MIKYNLGRYFNSFKSHRMIIMKKLNLLYVGIAFLVLAIMSCKNRKTSGTTDNQNVKTETDKAHNSKNTLDWAGVYKGVLPCTDCEGIETMIRITSNNTFVLETKLLGKSKEVNTEVGTFHWDDSGNKIFLDERNKSSGPFAFAVGENKLTQLDINGNYIGGKPSDKDVLKKDVTGLLETKWVLTELNGKPLKKSSSSKEANITLEALGNRVRGNGTCNSFTGTYKLSGNSGIKFSSLIYTELACDDISVENQFFHILEKVENYSLQGETLLLQNANKEVLVKFSASK